MAGGRRSRAASLLRLALFQLLYLCALAPLLPSAAQAEISVKFTYQGNLRQGGFLVNGQRSMVFRLYESSTSIVDLWTSPTYDVTVSTGVFRVTLEPVIADWHSGILWLELEVEGTRMSPREEMTPAPYAISSLMISGKRYVTAPVAPTGLGAGDLWFNSTLNALNYFNGTDWIGAGGGGGGGAAHALTHSGAGTDPILSLGAHTVTGNMLVEGILNPNGNLRMSGGGFYVQIASSVTAGWYHGNGAGLTNLNAARITSGYLNGDRLPPSVIVSTHIADASITRQKLAQSGCSPGEVLIWNGVQWTCGDVAGSGSETDPYSIHNQDVLQPGTTFYVSSGTVRDLNVINSLNVAGTAVIKGNPLYSGLSVEPTGNVAIGFSGAQARLEVRGAETQNYVLAVGTGTARQVVVSTSGAVGIGTESPEGRLAVTGEEQNGAYLAVFRSGSRLAAWLRNK
ncbi:MAG: hypothetical protein NDI60_07055 [Elusimicrobiales bacterium]|nr:hypothetical protein [Elusimicrobiales bacterium]